MGRKVEREVERLRERLRERVTESYRERYRERYRGTEREREHLLMLIATAALFMNDDPGSCTSPSHRFAM